MNEANIIIFDDSPKITEGIENNFRPEHNDGYSFKIIGSATDLDSAIELVDSLENGEVDVAIVDVIFRQDQRIIRTERELLAYYRKSSQIL